MSFSQNYKKLKGMKFGDLKVTGESHYTYDCYYLICQCWCGGLRIVEEKRLLAGKVRMCVGCEVRIKIDNWERRN